MRLSSMRWPTFSMTVFSRMMQLATSLLRTAEWW
jgi:hypothetical protein